MMRVAMLVAAAPNQTALCHKVAEQCDLALVVRSHNVGTRPRARLRVTANRAAGRVVGRPFRRAWMAMLERYAEAYPQPPSCPIIDVPDVNDAATLEAVQRYEADLVAVSGTSLVKDPLIEGALEREGIINLHTGLSPFMNGGPDCTDWCLATRRFELIGNTVMWLDAGIDSGALIATERTPLTGLESLPELHWKVMEHAHDLYARAISRVSQGRTVPRIPQGHLGAGRTFFRADWGARSMLMARWNFFRHYSPASVHAGAPDGGSVATVPLPSN